MSLRKIHRALLSVSDKTGLVDFASVLVDLQVELVSTGGTRKTLAEAGMPVRDISEVTGFPEILDGRVKTLHPKIHGGILAIRDNPEHQATLQAQKITPIDLVVCNLYPFEKTVAHPGSSHEEIIENIDIGGPSMVRSAAKNYHDVAIITDPSQYSGVIEELKANQGALSLESREQLAAAAFLRTATYDQAISSYFARKTCKDSGDMFLSILDLRFERRQILRYGENPHQQAAFYKESSVPVAGRPSAPSSPPSDTDTVRLPSAPLTPAASVATAEILHGKELSFNNILDLDSALSLVREFDEPCAVVIKHNNPCGAALGKTLEEAFQKAYESDPLSAYGGVIGFNQELDEATARQVTEPNRFVECVIAPGYSEAAFHLLTTRPSWKKSVRLLRTQKDEGGRMKDESKQESLSSSFIAPPSSFGFDYRRVDGGLLVQTRDIGSDDFANLKVVTKRQPTPAELDDLRFAWLVCKHVKSNAIVLVQDRMVVGVGAGQMSRVDSVHMAVQKAGDRSKSSVLASDAFFPFRDNIDLAAQSGVRAVIQPGGSMRDQDSIQACDEQGMAMVLTGVRHFRH
jgi:phosphoribosylaminoimidazolecarboxamide formyltransferase/IMP cyclohydrolase